LRISSTIARLQSKDRTFNIPRRETTLLGFSLAGIQEVPSLQEAQVYTGIGSTPPYFHPARHTRKVHGTFLSNLIPRRQSGPFIQELNGLKEYVRLNGSFV
jgi:hypothetical protein